MPSADRPNLLIVYTDQMRGMDMRCAGNTDMITPNLDRLAAEGVRCTHGLATTPICSPNRATLLTGTYPTTHGLMFNDTVWRSELPTLGAIARDAGYRTGYIGKWHLDGMPREKFTPPGHRRAGFDDFWAVHNCNHEYFMPMYYRDSPEMIRVPGYEPEVQTGLAEEFLDGSDDRARTSARCRRRACKSSARFGRHLPGSFGSTRLAYTRRPKRHRCLRTGFR